MRRKSNHLFPISMMTIFDVECCRASSSQLVKWLKVWRLNECDEVTSKSIASGHDSLCYIVDEQCACCATVVGASDGSKTFLSSLEGGEKSIALGSERNERTVSQICNLICFPSILIIRAPNSTPRWWIETSGEVKREVCISNCSTDG